MSNKTVPKVAAFLANFGDNVVLLVGVGCATAGACLFSARAGFITCGALLIGLTIVQNVIDIVGKRY